MNSSEPVLEPDPAATSVPVSSGVTPLAGCVHTALDNYFKELEGQTPGNLYQIVIAGVEHPLLTAVLAYTQGNQSKAARLLGINRSTLRKKLIQYGLETAAE
ncbi:Fis family transcriptional regulator, factor for inversion stimulation protein [Gammaproteobacteria bacterium]